MPARYGAQSRSACRIAATLCDRTILSAAEGAIKFCLIHFQKLLFKLLIANYRAIDAAFFHQGNMIELDVSHSAVVGLAVVSSRLHNWRVIDNRLRGPSAGRSRWPSRHQGGQTDKLGLMFGETHLGFITEPIVTSGS